MLSYFFTYGSALPPGVGFPMFGAAHIAWLLFGTAATLWLARKYKKLPAERQRVWDKAAGWFLACWILVRTLYLCIVRQMTVYELPLHLCSLAGFLCMLHAYKGYDGLGQVLYALCLPGTLSALLFPDWVYYPPIHFITIEGFLFHFGVAAYVVFQLLSGRIRPQLKGIWKVLLFLLITVPPIYLFNRRFNTNYFFVNVPSPGSPLEWFAQVLGVPGYLAGFAALVLAIVLLMEAAAALLQRKPKG